MEKPQQAQEHVDDLDVSIWVLFSKSLGSEKILLRFPEEPTYLYTESGDLEITSQLNGELFQLTVQKEGVPQEDLLYPLEGKWVHEHFVLTDSHFYHFKTLSDQPDSFGHRTFISSFLIEKNT